MLTFFWLLSIIWLLSSLEFTEVLIILLTARECITAKWLIWSPPVNHKSTHTRIVLILIVLFSSERISIFPLTCQLLCGAIVCLNRESQYVFWCTDMLRQSRRLIGPVIVRREGRDRWLGAFAFQWQSDCSVSPALSLSLPVTSQFDLIVFVHCSACPSVVFTLRALPRSTIPPMVASPLNGTADCSWGLFTARAGHCVPTSLRTNLITPLLK